MFHAMLPAAVNSSVSGPHGTDIELEGLAVVVDEAAVEVDVPRLRVLDTAVIEIVLEGRRRPVPRPILRRAEYGIERRALFAVIDDALQLSHVREPPVAVPGEAQLLAKVGRPPPIDAIRRFRLPVPVDVRHLLLPYEPSAGVVYGPISVVEEAAVARAARRVVAVLARSIRIQAGPPLSWKSGAIPLPGVGQAGAVPSAAVYELRFQLLDPR